jgi:hypothetical protein
LKRTKKWGFGDGSGGVTVDDVSMKILEET